MAKQNEKFINDIVTAFHNDFTDPESDLKHWSTAEELMISTILSAQATDISVNKVTPQLFENFKSPAEFANSTPEKIEPFINSINFYKSKAERIVKANQYLIDNHNGAVPKTIEEFVKVPGIGRKSANVVLQEAFGMTTGIVVDTHMKRVSQRLGLIEPTLKNAVKIEQQLMTIFPSSEWTFLSSAMVLHGRYICKARKPNCDKCSLQKICPSAFNLE